MGQSWCKKRTSKAEDSKSPLDRVFVRCAHRIYPSLKEEGSVLGGATQRVTSSTIRAHPPYTEFLELRSSEIGYAGSPPREILTRGQSIDSVDRPFHPSEWVDVNLEVPNTPRASSVLTNLTADTSLYPATCTPTSSCSNLKDVTPVPPPRHKKKNRGRPLPPKPDDIPQVHNDITKSEKNSKEEPLYSSVNHPKLRNDYVQNEEDIVGQRGTTKSDSSAAASEDTKTGGTKGKEIYEHKVNGTGMIIPSVVVSGKKSSRHVINENSKRGSREIKGHHKVQDDEYDKFARIPSSRDTSTPTKNEKERTTDLRMLITESSDRKERLEVPVRMKNYSTVSLPNYDELEVVKHEVERNGKSETTGEGDQNDDEDTEASKKTRRKVSTGSLPIESVFSSVSQKTAERVKNYVTRCRSFGSLLPHQIFDKLKSEEERISDYSDDDEWDGLDDWDLGVVEHCEPNDGLPPLEPSSRLCERKANSPKFIINGENILTTKKENGKSETVINLSSSSVPYEEDDEVKKQSSERNSLSLVIPKDTSLEAPKSPNSLKSAMKIETKSKSSTPTKLAKNDSSPTNLDDWFLAAQERSVRFSDSPTTERDMNGFGAKLEQPQVQSDRKKDLYSKNSLFSNEPKEPIHINSFFGFDEVFCGTTNTTGSASANPGNSFRLDSTKILKQSLSNESELFDGYEEKELVMDFQSQSSMSKLSRTISEESLPQEMLEDENDENFFDDKIVKDARNEMTKNTVNSNELRNLKTPPPSPEPKITAEILDNDHSILLKVLKEEAAEESNLSSMTPSLTELEAALSDMLEKENKQDEVEDEAEKATGDPMHSESGKSLNVSIEPKIVPIEKEKLVEDVLLNSKDLSSKELENTKRTLTNDKVIPNTPIAFDQTPNGSRNVSRKNMTSPSNQDEPTTMINVNLRNGKLHSERNSMLKEPGPSEKRVVSEIMESTSKKTFGNPSTNYVESLETEEHQKDVKVNPFDEPPEKPSRLHRVNLEESMEKESNVPTPPRRKHRSNSNPRKDDIYRTTDYAARDSDLYPNDRLI